MKWIEKILLTLPVLFIFLTAIFNSDESKRIIGFSGMYIGMAVLCIYYISNQKSTFYRIVLVLILLNLAGYFMQFNHLQGAFELVLAGLAGFVLFNGFLIKYALGRMNEDVSKYLLVIGIIFFVQFVFTWLPIIFGISMGDFSNYVTYLSFITVGAIGSIKLNSFNLPEGMAKVLNVTIILELFVIISSTVLALQ